MGSTVHRDICDLASGFGLISQEEIERFTPASPRLVASPLPSSLSSGSLSSQNDSIDSLDRPNPPRPLKGRVTPGLTHIDTRELSSGRISWQVGDVVPMQSTIEMVQVALEEVPRHEGSNEDKEMLVKELISKIFTYSRLRSGQTVRIPRLVNNKWVMVEYRPIMKDLKNGNRAYIFLPITHFDHASPIMSIRGTSLKDVGTVRSSLGFEGVKGLFNGLWFDVGGQLVKDNKEELLSVFKELKKMGFQQVELTGHSLGAAAAQKLFLEDDLRPYIKNVICYNSPTVNMDSIERWKALLSKDPSLARRVIVFQTEGDPVVTHSLQLLNRCLIGTVFRVKPDRTRNINLHSAVVSSHYKSKTRIESYRGEETFGAGLQMLALRVSSCVMGVIFGVIAIFVEIGTRFRESYYEERTILHRAELLAGVYGMAKETEVPKLVQMEWVHRVWWDRDEEFETRLYEVASEYFSKPLLDFLLQ